MGLGLWCGTGCQPVLLEAEDRFLRGQVRAAELHALLLLELVGLDVRAGRDLGDLADTERVEDVVRIEHLDGRLLEVVDRAVVEDVAVEVLADDLEDLVLELFTLGVELLELHLLADGLQRLGELGLEQLLERRLLRRAHAADLLGDAQHVVDGLVHADEERDLDVGADVVGADQTVLAAARDLDRLDRQIHDLHLVDDRQHDAAGERDLRLRAHLVDDHRAALIDLAPGARDQDQDAEEEHTSDRDEHDGHLLLHVLSPCPRYEGSPG